MSTGAFTNYAWGAMCSIGPYAWIVKWMVQKINP